MKNLEKIINEYDNIKNILFELVKKGIVITKDSLYLKNPEKNIKNEKN